MEYLTHQELKKMLLLSYQRIEEKKEEINKINIFPVPDQDTGNNMAKTLLGVKEAIEGKEFKDLTEISQAALNGALTTAQGNAGVIYVGFLAGFLPSLDKNPVEAKKLALAFEEGRKRAWQSIQNPKRGTILDVIDATAETFGEKAKKEKDITRILKKTLEKAREALLRTREKMEIFKKANVVDAGGLGFLLILESYLEALEKEKKREKKEEMPSEKVRKFIQVLANRYEIVSLIENPRFEEKEIGKILKNLGDSLDIVQIGNKIKVHIHTDYPDEVREEMRKMGRIEDLRIEDMAKEVAGEESVRKVSIGIVTEDLSSLLPKILERYQIELVHVILDWPEIEKFPGENICQKIRVAWKTGLKTPPKTFQAPPKSYLDAYKKQLQRFNQVLCLTISSKLSGCYNSAIQARAMLAESEKERIYVLDSSNVVVGEALLVLRAIELIQEQREITEILDELKNLIPQTHLYLIFEDPKGIESVGRNASSQTNWIRKMKKLGVHPIIELKDGIFSKGGIVLTRDMSQALFKKIAKESKKIRAKGKKIRAVINHVDNLEGAKKLKEALKEIEAEVSFISEGPPTVCAIAGPGSLIAGWQPIE